MFRKHFSSEMTRTESHSWPMYSIGAMDRATAGAPRISLCGVSASGGGFGMCGRGLFY